MAHFYDYIDMPYGGMGMPYDEMDMPCDEIDMLYDEIDMPYDEMDIPDDEMGIPYDEMGMLYGGMGDPSGGTEIVFYTCGFRQRPGRRDLEDPIIHEIDCRGMKAPGELCELMTGQASEFKQRLFSDPLNAMILEEETRRLERALRRWRNGPCAVIIFCTMGVHRSVATAEVLADRLGVMEVNHMTMERNFADYRERKMMERMGVRPPRRR